MSEVPRGAQDVAPRPATGEVAPGPSDDQLAALCAELEQLEQRPVAERVARFEAANDTLARELALLDEV